MACFDYISDMKLDWCKVPSVESDKFSGWNYSLMDTVASDVNFVSPNKPVECWSTAECKQSLKYYALHCGKTAFDARNMAAEAYHDASVLKIPPEEQ
eukprot:11344919-Ditylum_brightwellii.AAC.1